MRATATVTEWGKLARHSTRTARQHIKTHASQRSIGYCDARIGAYSIYSLNSRPVTQTTK